jgi:peptidoglycan/xylan/chitin deacetylase (PgdA/CDA1 family)
MVKKLLLWCVPALLFVLGLLFIPKIGAAGTNLIANPSVETSANNLPANWTSAKTGTNTTAFNYLTTGRTGSRSLQVNMTSRSSGQAYWTSDSVNIAPNTKYTFSDWYQSNVSTTLVVTITNTGGATSTQTLGLTASNSWKQATISFTTPARGAHLTVRHYINRVGQVTTDDYDLEGPAPVPPVVNLTGPAAGATVKGAQTISATASDAVGVAGVQFAVDGVNSGSQDTTSPYSVSWDTTKVANGNHTISATATGKDGLTSSVSETVNVQNVPATPPTVNLTAPANNATVSGTTTISADATDSQGVTSVQFKLNGNNLGSPDTIAPFSYSWNTAAVTDGNYSLTAMATNKTGLSATSAPVAVTVKNQTSTGGGGNGPNIILNPSVETSANGSAPDNWLSSNWGNNTSTFSYLPTGHTGSHSLKVQTTAWTDGAANWYYNDLPVTAGATYQYSNWYQSNVDTEVDAEVVMNDGTTNYYYLGAVLASPTAWTKFTTTFTPPAGAKSLAVYQILAKVGYITTDDYSLSTYTPAQFNRAIVSVTFDDGWTNQYQNAYPVLQANGIPATFYIISGELTDQPDYMTAAQVKTLFTSGNEIASHSVTHPDLTTVSQTKLVQEMQQSQATLQNVIGVPVTNFAYPYGAYNSNTIAVGKQYYRSQRTVNAGYNTKDNFDLTQLKIYEVDSNISQAQVQGWINGAIAQKTWLILVYHEIATSPVDPSDALYTTQPGDLSAEMAYLKGTGVAVETVSQAIDEILPQL